MPFDSVVRKVLALDPVTGVPLPFSPVTVSGGSGIVESLAVAGNRLYVGGSFSSVNGETRPTSPPSTRPPARSSRGRRSWAGGCTDRGEWRGGRHRRRFNSVGGIAKRNLVAIDSQNRSPNCEGARRPFTVNAMLRLGDVMVVAGQRVYGTSDPTLRRFTTTGALLPWSLSSDGAITSLATDGRRLFIGGGFSRLSGAPRQGLASVDLHTRL